MQSLRGKREGGTLETPWQEVRWWGPGRMEQEEFRVRRKAEAGKRSQRVESHARGSWTMFPHNWRDLREQA